MQNTNATAWEIFEDFLPRVGGDRLVAATLTLAESNFASGGKAAQVSLPDALLTVRQAAKRLSVSESTVYRLCESGALRCQRVGSGRGAVRIRPRDLAAIESQAAQGSAKRGRVTLAQLEAM